MTSREVEINATPEQVWEAIATGAGERRLALPAEIDEREGGSVLIHRAPYGGDAPATVTPTSRRGGSPTWSRSARHATSAREILVEGRAGGTTVVRVVTGFYEGGEGWEPMAEGAGEGWGARCSSCASTSPTSSAGPSSTSARWATRGSR